VCCTYTAELRHYGQALRRLSLYDLSAETRTSEKVC
jgi:hypothetical protein